MRHDLRGSHRPIARHITPAAIKIVAIGQVNRPATVDPLRVGVGAAPQQLVDRIELSRHRGPVNRLVRSLVPLAEKLRLRVEQLAHPFEVVFPQRRRDRLALRRGVKPRFERVRQQLLHLPVPAIACYLNRVVVYPEIQRVPIVFEKKADHVDAVLAHGEIERLAIVVVRSRERWIFCDELPDAFEIARRTGLHEGPHVGAAPRRPQQFLFGFQPGWLHHAVCRLHGFDVVYQFRPTLEAVLARERVLRGGQVHRWIGGAKSFEMFLGLLAELLERRMVRQTTGRGKGHDDLLSDIARVRSTG